MNPYIIQFVIPLLHEMEVRHVSNIQTSTHAFLVGGDVSGRNLTSMFIESSKHLAQDPSLR